MEKSNKINIIDFFLFLTVIAIIYFIFSMFWFIKYWQFLIYKIFSQQEIEIKWINQKSKKYYHLKLRFLRAKFMEIINKWIVVRIDSWIAKGSWI